MSTRLEEPFGGHPGTSRARGYVARVLGLLGGAGVVPAGGRLEVRLLR